MTLPQGYKLRREGFIIYILFLEINSVTDININLTCLLLYSSYLPCAALFLKSNHPTTFFDLKHYKL